MEGAERSKDGAANPDAVLALGGSDDLDLHAAWCERRNLLAHAVGDARKHGGSPAEHDIPVQILPDINVALHDRVISRLVDSRRLHPDHRRLEEDFRAAEPLRADGDYLPVGQLVGLLHGGTALGGFQLLLVVQRDVGQLFLDVADDFALGGGGEGVAPLREDLHQRVGEVSSGQVQPQYRVRQRVSFVDGHRVAHSVSRVKHNPFSHRQTNIFRSLSAQRSTQLMMIMRDADADDDHHDLYRVEKPN